MNLDAIMWLIVLFGGCFVLIGIPRSLFLFGLKVDSYLRNKSTPIWLDNILIKTCFFVPITVYCYFWYNAAMSLAEQL